MNKTSLAIGLEELKQCQKDSNNLATSFSAENFTPYSVVERSEITINI